MQSTLTQVDTLYIERNMLQKHYTKKQTKT